MDVEQYVLQVLFNGAGPWPLNDEQRKVLSTLRFHVGEAAAIKGSELCRRHDLSERQLKDVMRSLVVDFKIRIGASRQQPYGYYLVKTAEDAEHAAAPYEKEIRELARRVRVLRGQQFLAELCGQLALEEEKSA